MTDIVVCSGIAGGRADEFGVFMYNGNFGTIRDSIKLEIPPTEKKQGTRVWFDYQQGGNDRYWGTNWNGEGSRRPEWDVTHQRRENKMELCALTKCE